MLLMGGCFQKSNCVPQIIKVSPPSFLYTDCGSGKISELTGNSTIADMLLQSLERKKELDKCIESNKKLKEWSDS